MVTVTKEIFDCNRRVRREVSNSVEKMGACLLEKFFQHITKDIAGEKFCAKPNNVINKIFECENSSNNINEFKDCLIIGVLTVFENSYHG